MNGHNMALGGTMSQRKIFLCYSRKDLDLFESFVTHLSPFEREGALLVWSDHEIRPGDDWDRKIHDMMDDADAAVVLVSPDALASDYVVEKELPRLIAAALAGHLVLTCLYLRSANADALHFDTGTGERVALTHFQALNQPTDPVAARVGAERDALLAACAGKLWQLTAEIPGKRELLRRRGVRELTVELRLRDGRVDRRYSLPGWDLQKHASVDRGRLEALLDLHPEEHPELGTALFEVVLGSDWTEVLPKVTQDDRGTPIRHGIRLRVVTDDPLLDRLPWATCHWNGYHLADMGWTFELAARGPARPVWLDTPCTALMIGAETDGAAKLGVEGHWASFQALLHRAWRHPLNTRLFRLAGTFDAVRQALKEGPRLVYVYGRAGEGAGGLELALADGVVPFTFLTAAWAERPPEILVLNTVGRSPLAPRLPRVPVIVHLRHAEGNRGARGLAQAFWSDVLESGADPVRAFHDLGARAWRCGVVRTEYQGWEVRLSDLTPKDDRPRAWLDRLVQREAVMTEVRKLANEPHRRVSCVVAWGSGGNLVNHFAVQVVATLKDWARGLARIQRHDLPFPSSRGALSAADFEEVMRDSMHLQPEQDLSAAFAAPRRGGPAQVHVHFLNWGCYGPGQRPALKASHLEAWLDFCCGPLAAAAGGVTRILSYVAVVVAADKHAALAQRLDELARLPRLRQPHFELRHLQPLRPVTPKDLDDFLAIEGNTSCPAEYRHDIAERICASTGGEFEATVELLEEAERGMMWPDLYHNLPPAAAPAAELEDFDLE